jgi:hypothetical protein
LQRRLRRRIAIEFALGRLAIASLGKSIAVLRDRLRSHRASQELTTSLGRDRKMSLHFAVSAAPELPFASSLRNSFAIEGSFFERRRGFAAKYFLLLCLLCAMLLKIFYR